MKLPVQLEGGIYGYGPMKKCPDIRYDIRIYGYRDMSRIQMTIVTRPGPPSQAPGLVTGRLGGLGVTVTSDRAEGFLNILK